MGDFRELVDLAAARLGGTAIEANDEFFAEKENLLKAERPVFVPDKYTDRGKWMDGWETRRRRVPGHDWCIIRLGLPGVIKGVVVDTSFFTGNFPSQCSLDACAVQSDAEDKRWVEIVSKRELRGDFEHVFTVDDPNRFTHVRLNIFPDGGVARLRIHGEVLPDWNSILSAGGEVDVSTVAHGGRAVDCSDRFYSHPQNLLMPYVAADMGGGWETKRRRGPGHDWAIVRLGIAAEITRIEVDTTHFKGNYPESCSLEAATSEDERAALAEWTTILPRTPLGPDQLHVFSTELHHNVQATHVRLNIFPDGGVSRLRVYGAPTRDGLERESLRALNAADGIRLLAALTDCCGARVWVDRLAAARPFVSVEALLHRSDEIWRSLGHEDWLEAFRRHPRIGESQRVMDQSVAAHVWSKQEQAGAQDADPAVLMALAEGNRAYEARFGYVFIVCAAGRSGEEILGLMRQRLENDPAQELEIAAAEQARITRLRLEKVLRTKF